MNWLDFILIIFLLLALVRGIQSGFVRQFFSTIGFLLGFFLGAWIQGYLIDLVDSPQSKALLSLVIILGCALILMTVGEYFGLRARDRLERFKAIDKTDRWMGAIVGCAAMLVGIWLGAAIFASTPVGDLQQRIRSSRIISTLNHVLPDAPNVISKLGQFINPNAFPQVFVGLEPKLKTDTPLPDLGELTLAVEQTRASIVKVAGEGCGGIVEGSGFVADEGLIITNAHVVAGVRKPKIIDTNGQHDATVMWFDPKLDVAILRTNDNLAGKPLSLQASPVPTSTKSVVLGFPGGAGFTASPAAVLEQFKATGRDIYNRDATERSVYSIKADIRHGNSGGPLIAADGSVIGVIFAESTDHEDVGYALTMDQVIKTLQVTKANNKPTSTGLCAQ